jgi:hypothetical protein
MSDVTALQETVPEQTTVRITGAIVDEAGAALGSTTLTTLTMTLYSRTTGLPLIGAAQQNILNTGKGSIDGTGNFVLTLPPSDNAIVSTPAPAVEPHEILLEWTWPSGKAGKHRIQFSVRNLSKVI